MGIKTKEASNSNIIDQNAFNDAINEAMLDSSMIKSIDETVGICESGNYVNQAAFAESMDNCMSLTSITQFSALWSTTAGNENNVDQTFIIGQQIAGNALTSSNLRENLV